jgi:hypothetical protein
MDNMALQITNLNELDTARTTELLALFKQLVQEKYPNIELSRGVFHDLVLYFNSVLNSAVQDNIDRVLQSNSLLSINKNPALADDTLVDKVLSNYGLERYAGARATGEATVIVTQLATTLVSDFTALSANGVTFRPTRSFTGILPNQTATSPGDRTLIPAGNGTYAFTINIIADEVGAAGNLPRGTLLLPNAAPSNVNKIFLTANITNGADELNNAEYVNKLSAGLVAKTLGGRKAIAGTIRNQSEFQNIRHISVVGFGDPEQQRDQHTLIPVSGGGRVDIYAQTNNVAQKVDNFVSAIYIGPADPNDDAAGTIWQFTLTKDVSPGFYDIYRVAQIEDATSAGYQLTTYTPGYNTSGFDYAPDIANMLESEFTRYKTATARFIDTDKPPIDLIVGQSAATYCVTTRAMPLIGALQDFVSSREIRSVSSDILVKAAVPCFTTIDFAILKTANEVDPDFAAIKKDIVTAISNVGFGGILNSSVIAAVAHKYLTGNQAVGKIDMFGRILRPDGKIAYIRDFSKLEIPNDPDRFVSPKTTVFLTDIEDIVITSQVVTGFNS